MGLAENVSALATRVANEFKSVRSELTGKANSTHSHPVGQVSGLGTAATADTGTGATNVILGNDARLTNARTPTTHSHTTAQVTGLDGVLSGKADTSHNHAVTDLAVGSVADGQIVGRVGSNIAGINPKAFAKIGTWTELGPSNVIPLGEMWYVTDYRFWFVGDGVTTLGTLNFFALQIATRSYVLTSVRIDNTAKSGTDYVITGYDENDLVKMMSATACTVTIPTNAVANFAIGAQVHVSQFNTGQVTIVGQSGVTLRYTPTTKLRAQFSTVTLLKIGTDEWLIFGDLAAS